jgi:hypothetical protein
VKHFKRLCVGIGAVSLVLTAIVVICLLPQVVVAAMFLFAISYVVGAILTA